MYQLTIKNPFIMIKKLFFLNTLFLFGMTANAQVKGPEISIDKEVHDFGNVKQNANTECYFTITNTGTEPLVLSDVKPSCSCTVPEWPKEPIKAGESAKIKVKYNSSRVGPINKTVTITSNDPVKSTLTIRIKGNVEAEEGGGSPIKGSNGPVEGK